MFFFRMDEISRSGFDKFLAKFQKIKRLSSPPNASFDNRLFQISPYFRFYGLFPVYISLFFKKSQISPILTFYSSKWLAKPKYNF